MLADLYGKGDRAVVLAHGGRFNKESWREQAETLRAAGSCFLAIDFRGYGQSRGAGQADPLSAPLYLDVLAAVRYLKAHGARSAHAEFLFQTSLAERIMREILRFLSAR